VILPLIPVGHSEITKTSWPLSVHPSLDPHCLVTQTNGAPLFTFVPVRRVCSEVGLWLVFSPSPVDHLLGMINYVLTSSSITSPSSRTDTIAPHHVINTNNDSLCLSHYVQPANLTNMTPPTILPLLKPTHSSPFCIYRSHS
jgi:hypothetical protein